MSKRQKPDNEKDPFAAFADLPEGTPGTEADPAIPTPVNSRVSTQRQKSMLALLELADKRVKEPDFDRKIEKSIHALNDFAPNPTRYARQQRLILTIKRASKPEVKKTLSGYVLIEHRDQYDTHTQGRRLLVESDKTSFVIVGHYVDKKNIIGRSLRKSNAVPISTLADTLGDLLGLDEG